MSPGALSFSSAAGRFRVVVESQCQNGQHLYSWLEFYAENSTEAAELAALEISKHASSYEPKKAWVIPHEMVKSFELRPARSHRAVPL